MKDLILTRYYMPDCTLGTITGDDGLDIVTMERPWELNRPFYSCVPEGEYRVTRDSRPSHNHTFCLVNHNLGVYKYPTDGRRDSILIHVGNKVSDFAGCIGPGTHFGTKAPTAGYSAEGENIVMGSMNAYRRLNKYIGDDQEFTLVIRQYTPEPWR